ncbi:Pentapeptide repeat-containing protein [Actinokineospora terrae]|uniref:Pentapeptide repeat-containing protein n=1 Tax=Actinokineospora terrae TaxID=155974 RepID=A0A1H9Q3L4_9PSEU|nr:Pentapeptide repeat-containing protein [Actinokineospora terrae]
MLAVVTPVVLVTAAAVLVLSRVLDISTSAARLEMIRTALTIGAGTGALTTLVLALRRQWATEHDATERRLTDLYVKAIDQLGSDKPPVRHGALYALERIAQDNPAHRQTVVNLICAYLRGPWIPPTNRPAPRVGGLRKNRSTGLSSTDQGKREEHEVRNTASRILHRHLQRDPASRRPSPTFWPDIDLDLAGAVLVDFSLDHCAVRAATFAGATFTRDVTFAGAVFAGAVRFDRATFTGTCSFYQVAFKGTAWFASATFKRLTFFGSASFGVSAGFEDAVFEGFVLFEQATWSGDGTFVRTAFDEVSFDNTVFRRSARFKAATFTRLPTFREAELRAGGPDPLRPSSPFTDFTDARFVRGVPPEIRGFVDDTPG